MLREREKTLPMTAILDLLKTRRSPRIPDLAEPGPSRAEIETLLTIAARVPDHGKLAPWRFVVMQGEKKREFADALIPIFRQAHPEATDDQVRKEPERFATSPLVIAVISKAAKHPKIPEWEQMLSAGAAAMNLVTAAHALGYGANWVTGWAAYERPALALLGIGADERVAGFIHIGTPKMAQEERPRPPLSEIVTYL
jgi:nitroreductase